jgi:thiol-disulfide isomerase/thioredoxin
MNTTRLLFLSAALALGTVACGGDKDNDGDGLTNSEERELGTDKNEADSEGDGYTDLAEFQAESDPNDASSLVYTGGWPVNLDKDAMASIDDFSGNPASGGQIPRVIGKDQFGEDVDLYDFLNQGKPVIIDVSAFWCPPCQFMAQWLEHDPSTAGSYLDEYNNVRDAVESEEVIWVTFLSQGDSPGDRVFPRHVAQWYEAFPYDKVPVIMDREQRFADWMGLEAFPTVLWVNPDGTIQAYRSDDNTRGLSRLSERLDEVLGN